MALAAHPSQYELLRTRPELAVSAAEELLRFDTPLQMFERWVLEDLDWKGLRLEKGTKVGLLFGSANHDEDVFSAPAQLDIERDPNAHVSFGGGAHLCVGAPLARIELAVAFAELATRVAHVAITTPELTHTPSLVFRGLDDLKADIA